jgi:alkylhydroperoxidase/carboxymuconolactone decarboxylase family protein YurZ
MPHGSIVNFEAYRHHEKVRKETSNAIRGLTVSVGFSSLFIKTFEDSKEMLPDLFPNVPHIEKLNLSARDARNSLDNMHKHLGAMGVPYTLGVHEHYMNTCLTLLKKK